MTDDILECVTVELSVSKPMRKTVTISCIYRTPGSNIDIVGTCYPLGDAFG